MSPFAPNYGTSGVFSRISLGLFCVPGKFPGELLCVCVCAHSGQSHKGHRVIAGTNYSPGLRKKTEKMREAEISPARGPPTSCAVSVGRNPRAARGAISAPRSSRSQLTGPQMGSHGSKAKSVSPQPTSPSQQEQVHPAQDGILMF